MHDRVGLAEADPEPADLGLHHVPVLHVDKPVDQLVVRRQEPNPALVPDPVVERGESSMSEKEDGHAG